MKGQSLIFLSFLVSALAAPAVVWKSSKRSSNRVLHSSDDLKAPELMVDVLDVEVEGSSLAAVVFLVGRTADGSDSFSELASKGQLPLASSKYDDADAVYHHVSGIESAETMVRHAALANPALRVLQVSMSEFNSMMTSRSEPAEKIEMVEISEGGVVSKPVKHAYKRARDLANANVVIVKVDINNGASELDSAVARAIEDDSVQNVVLAGIRSLSEVKHERNMIAKSKRNVMEVEGNRVILAQRRRLQDNQDGDNVNADLSGVYYVSMTPNILAGLLFGLLFAVVTWIGINCMNAIVGQDVYVSKMPSIGREA